MASNGWGDDEGTARREKTGNTPEDQTILSVLASVAATAVGVRSRTDLRRLSYFGNGHTSKQLAGLPALVSARTF